MQKEIREKGSTAMAEKDYAGFVTAFDEGKLNKPEWPAEVIARLSLEAKQELSGKFLVLVTLHYEMSYHLLTVIGGMHPNCPSTDQVLEALLWLTVSNEL